MTAQIVNPTGAFNPPADYRTGTDGSGFQTARGAIQQYRANAAIAQGDCVKLVAATATVPVSVTPGTADAVTAIGIATEAAATGELCSVCVYGGPVLANIGAGSVTDGDVLEPGAAGIVATAATPAAGTTIGVAIGTEIGTSNQILMYVYKA